MGIEGQVVSLLPYIADVLVLETEIEEVLTKMPASREDHAEAAGVVRGLRTSVKRHRENLQDRMLKISRREEDIARMAPGAKGTGTSGQQVSQSVSGALRILHGLVSQAALGYAVLHAVAHRFFDSRGEGNTADLAEGHLRDYAIATQALNRIVSDVAVWELGKLGQECQCKCPSCGLGVCLCSPHGRNTVADVWREMSAPRAEEQVSGIRVRPPRTDSPAARAGLRAGDFVLIVDGRDVGDESWDSVSTIQDAIKKHQPGELVRFRIRRASGILEEVPVTRA